MQQDHDLQLAADLLAHKPGAFDRFVSEFRVKLFQYSYLMCGHRDDAEEVSQDTLLQVFKGLGQLRDPARLKAWVFRIAKNACLMKRRKSVFAPVAELSLSNYMPKRIPGREQAIEIADWSNLPEGGVLKSELHERLRRAIAELPETYRSVLLLRDMEGLKSEETAEVLEISVDAVKQRLHRARLAVRSKLDEYMRDVEETENGSRIHA